MKNFDSATLLSQLQQSQPQLEKIRHELHAHPELGFHETRTANKVAELLKEWGYDVATGIGGTGIVASLTKGSGSKSIGLRADMDALPIHEASGVKYQSGCEGKMHACGHDGHTSMLLGAAQWLASDGASFNGTVRLIFQPSEEDMRGAQAMIDDGLFTRFPVDAVYGMHNMPGYPQGHMAFKEGATMAAVDSLTITLTGKGSHGSTPEKSIDPIVAGASLVMALQTIVSRNIAAQDQAVVSVGAFQAGDAGNVIPQQAVLRLSIRSTDEDVRKTVLQRIRTITESQASCYGVTAQIESAVAGVVLMNTPHETAFAKQVAVTLLGNDKVVDMPNTFMGSEDFAFMLKHKPGCYCVIGNGDSPMLHHPQYDFDDRNLSVGAAYWVALTQSYLV
ncbi:M20 aminoacylase family protein [Hafnia sp. HMSC23F03]|uniref:M20 aminoacylase family protein n=1 Tax=Hafnia sp. HMSC23F03 TaxID=1581059 RepID=UPI0008A274D0|nr:M20 aminoacylase family protein [Hafnia sp. HMSC23F03]OFS09043.1 amidohydrolase [Hafnia sp. HMSC23F03]